MPLPRWVEPQLSKLVERAQTGPRWVHEIKFDGYRMAARVDSGKVQLITRSELDWTAKYPATAAGSAIRDRVRRKYLVKRQLMRAGPSVIAIISCRFVLAV